MKPLKLNIVFLVIPFFLITFIVHERLGFTADSTPVLQEQSCGGLSSESVAFHYNTCNDAAYGEGVTVLSEGFCKAKIFLPEMKQYSTSYIASVFQPPKVS